MALKNTKTEIHHKCFPINFLKYFDNLLCNLRKSYQIWNKTISIKTV